MDGITYYIIVGCLAWIFFIFILITLTPSKYVMRVNPEALSSIWRDLHWSMPTHMLKKQWQLLRYSQVVAGIIICLSFAIDFFIK